MRTCSRFFLFTILLVINDVCVAGTNLYIFSDSGEIFKVIEPGESILKYVCAGCREVADGIHSSRDQRRFPCEKPDCNKYLCAKCDWSADACPGCGGKRTGETGMSYPLDVDKSIQNQIDLKEEVICLEPGCLHNEKPFKLGRIDCHEHKYEAEDEQLDDSMEIEPVSRNISVVTGTDGCQKCEEFRKAKDFQGDRLSAAYQAHRLKECQINKRLCDICTMLVLKKDLASHEGICMSTALKGYMHTCSGATGSQGEIPLKVIEKIMIKSVELIEKLVKEDAGKNKVIGQLTEMVKQQEETAAALNIEIVKLEKQVSGAKTELIAWLQADQQIPSAESILTTVPVTTPGLSVQAMIPPVVNAPNDPQYEPKPLASLPDAYQCSEEQRAIENVNPVVFSLEDEETDIKFGENIRLKIFRPNMQADAGHPYATGKEDRYQDRIYAREIKGYSLCSEIAFLVNIPEPFKDFNMEIFLPEFTLLTTQEGTDSSKNSRMRVVLRRHKNKLEASIRYAAGSKPYMGAEHVFQRIGFLTDKGTLSERALNAIDQTPFFHVEPDPEKINWIAKDKYAESLWSLETFKQTVTPATLTGNDTDSSFCILVVDIHPAYAGFIEIVPGTRYEERVSTSVSHEFQDAGSIDLSLPLTKKQKLNQAADTE